MNYDDMRKAERAYRRDFPSPPSRRERERAFQAGCAPAPGPASGSALDTTLVTGRTKNSQIIHVTSAALKTIYGYRRALCGASLAEMLWDTVHPNDVGCIDCNNCRSIALRRKQNPELTGGNPSGPA